MHAKSLLLACGAVAAASALAGCGSSQSTTSDTHQLAAATFELGAERSVRAGRDHARTSSTSGADTAAPIRAGASGHGPGNHGWSPTYGGWYRGGPSHVVRTPTPVAGIDGTVRQVASSNSDGYGLTTTGRVYAWGAGAQGELGERDAPDAVAHGGARPLSRRRRDRQAGGPDAVRRWHGDRYPRPRLGVGQRPGASVLPGPRRRPHNPGAGAAVARHARRRCADARGLRRRRHGRQLRAQRLWATR